MAEKPIGEMPGQTSERKEFEIKSSIRIDLSPKSYLVFNPDKTIEMVLEPEETGMSERTMDITPSEAIEELNSAETNVRDEVEEAEEEFKFAEANLAEKKQMLQNITHLREHLSH